MSEFARRVYEGQQRQAIAEARQKARRTGAPGSHTRTNPWRVIEKGDIQPERTDSDLSHVEQTLGYAAILARALVEKRHKFKTFSLGLAHPRDDMEGLGFFRGTRTGFLRAGFRGEPFVQFKPSRRESMTSDWSADHPPVYRGFVSVPGHSGTILSETGHLVSQSGKEFWIKTAEEIADDKSSKAYEDNLLRIAISNKAKPARFDTQIADLDEYRNTTRKMAQRKKIPSRLAPVAAVALVGTLILADGDSDISTGDRKTAWQDFLVGNTFSAGDIDNSGQIEEVMIASVDNEGHRRMAATLERGRGVDQDAAENPAYQVAFALEYCSPGDTPEPDLGEINDDCKLIPVEVTANDLRNKDWTEGDFFGGR